MTEIRGWLGIEGSQIVIECRGKWRKEAKRLQAGVIVDFVAEKVSRSHTVAGTGWGRDWIGPLDLEQIPKAPVGWRDAPASHDFSWSRVDLTATAKLECQIKTEKTSSGRTYTVVEIKQIKPSEGGSQRVMEVRLRIYVQDAAGKPTTLLTPQNGMIVARKRKGRHFSRGTLRARFTPSIESEHGYHFEIVEVLAAKPRWK